MLPLNNASRPLPRSIACLSISLGGACKCGQCGSGGLCACCCGWRGTVLCHVCLLWWFMWDCGGHAKDASCKDVRSCALSCVGKGVRTGLFVHHAAPHARGITAACCCGTCSTVLSYIMWCCSCSVASAECRLAVVKSPWHHRGSCRAAVAFKAVAAQQSGCSTCGWQTACIYLPAYCYVSCGEAHLKVWGAAVCEI